MHVNIAPMMTLVSVTIRRCRCLDLSSIPHQIFDVTFHVLFDVFASDIVRGVDVHTDL